MSLSHTFFSGVFAIPRFLSRLKRPQEPSAKGRIVSEIFWKNSINKEGVPSYNISFNIHLNQLYGVKRDSGRYV